MLFDTLFGSSGLLAANPASITEEAVTKGRDLITDGGGGTFYYDDTTSGLADDGGTIFQSTYSGATGFWVRIYDSQKNVRWFGAKGDGVTDDTTAVQLAINAATNTNGSLYFPRGTYPGAFEIYVTANAVSLTGEGPSTILKSNGAEDKDGPIPVLRLGRKSPLWSPSKISNLVIDGSYGDEIFADGAVFYDSTPGPGSVPQFSGRWMFEEVTFQKCNRGIFKPYGNIGNKYTDCYFIGNNFAFYGQGHVEYNGAMMHAGSDYFIRGTMEGNTSACIFLNDATGQFGQFVVDGTVIQGNPGFAFYVDCQVPYINDTVTPSQEVIGNTLLGTSLTIRNVWLENHYTSSVSLNYVKKTIHIPTPMPPAFGPDYVVTETFLASEVRDFYIKGVRSMSIYDTAVVLMHLKSSVCNLYNCITGDFGGNYGIEVDEASALTAYDLRYIGTASKNMFVHSLSYNNNSPAYALSLWSPFRDSIAKGIYNAGISKPYDGTNSYTFSDGTNPYNSTQIDMGILHEYCAEFTVPSGVTFAFDPTLSFTPANGKYYCWSMHAYLVSGEGGGVLQNWNGGTLGNLILKEGQWTCSSGIKHYKDGDTSSGFTFFLYPNVATGMTVRIADIQAVEFDTLNDALAFHNSKAFVSNKTPMKSVKAYGTVNYNTTTIVNAYNLASVVKNSTGNYTVNFTYPVSSPYSVQLTPLYKDFVLQVDSNSSTSFNVLINENSGVPGDCDFSISVF